MRKGWGAELRPVSHIIAAGAMAAPAYVITHSTEATAAFCAASVVMDVDHLMDYFIFGERPLTATAFFRPGAPEKWERLIFLLHSYEFIAVMAALSIYSSIPIMWPISAGFAVHLLMDEVGNRMPWKATRIRPFFYFFTFRLLKGFRRAGISMRRDASS